MKPEEKARIIIDRMLNDAGWEVVDRNHYSPEVSAIAVEEGLLKGNREADYLLFLNGKQYLYHVFKAMITEFYTQSHGSGMVHITKKQFENIKLLLPPLEEQKRIVQTLEQISTKLDVIMGSL